MAKIYHQRPSAFLGSDLDDDEMYLIDQRATEIGGQQEKVESDRAVRQAKMKGR